MAMNVAFHKTDRPDLKPGQTNRVYRCHPDTPGVSVCIDKLVIDCIPLHGFYEWVETMQDMRYIKDTKAGSRNKAWRVPGYGYFREFTPAGSDERWLRYEFNPQNPTQQGAEGLLGSILAARGVSRVDVALDYAQDLSDFHIDCKRRGKTKFETRTDAHSGRVAETIYLGAGTSASQIRVYDKAKQSKLDAPLWRIEAEYKPRSPLTVIPEDLFDPLIVLTWPPRSDLDFATASALNYAHDKPGVHRDYPAKTRKRVEQLQAQYLKPLNPAPAEAFRLARPALQRTVGRFLSDIAEGDVA
jgi:hypothetical protein